MEFDDPVRIKQDKHAVQHGSYPEQDPTGQAALLNEDDKQRQLTTFESKFSDAKQPYVWGTGFMGICSVIAAIHMSDMSAQTNVLILDHANGDESKQQNIIYVQLQDIGPKPYSQHSEPMLDLLLPPPLMAVKPETTKSNVKNAGGTAPATQNRTGELLKARRALLQTQMH